MLIAIYIVTAAALLAATILSALATYGQNRGLPAPERRCIVTNNPAFQAGRACFLPEDVQ